MWWREEVRTVGGGVVGWSMLVEVVEEKEFRTG